LRGPGSLCALGVLRGRIRKQTAETADGAETPGESQNRWRPRADVVEESAHGPEPEFRLLVREHDLLLLFFDLVWSTISE